MADKTAVILGGGKLLPRAGVFAHSQAKTVVRRRSATSLPAAGARRPSTVAAPASSSREMGK